MQYTAQPTGRLPDHGAFRLAGVQRVITGYHQDDNTDWVAELACGHDQHVRHRPPFEERAWVQEAAGRSGRIGRPLECPLCDRCELPAHLRLVRTTPEWNEDNLPAGLRRAHRIGAGVWGRMRVHDGRLRLSMATQPGLEIELGQGAEQAIPPEVDHQVQPLGKVRLALDFLVVDRAHRIEARPCDQGGDPACWAGQVCPECGGMLDDPSHRSRDCEPGAS